MIVHCFEQFIYLSPRHLPLYNNVIHREIEIIAEHHTEHLVT